MLNAVVLAESRRGSKTVLIERIKSKIGDHQYRVTVCRRFPTLAKARDAFLSETPPSMAAMLTKQIADSSNSSLMN